MKGAVRNVDRQLLVCLRIFVHSSVCVFVCVGRVFYVFFFFSRISLQALRVLVGSRGLTRRGGREGNVIKF